MKKGKIKYKICMTIDSFFSIFFNKKFMHSQSTLPEINATNSIEAVAADQFEFNQLMAKLTHQLETVNNTDETSKSIEIPSATSPLETAIDPTDISIELSSILDDLAKGLEGAKAIAAEL